MRDPALLRRPDGSFHLVWTTSWVGHTIGHAVESLLSYEWRHGECVSVGMVAAARIAVNRSIIFRS